jgi:hypothetical protein
MGQWIQNSNQASLQIPGFFLLLHATLALEELLTPVLLPSVLSASSITMPDTIQPYFREIAERLTRRQLLFLCYVRWEFNANDNIDIGWNFYRCVSDVENLPGSLDEALPKYNLETGENIAPEEAMALFSDIMACNRLLSIQQSTNKKYRGCSTISRTG